MSYASWRGRGPKVIKSLEGAAYKHTLFSQPGLAGLGADELPDESDQVVIRRVDQNVIKLVAELEADAQRRKVTVVLTAIGVVFAAVKLGFIDFPTYFRSRKEGG